MNIFMIIFLLLHAFVLFVCVSSLMLTYMRYRSIRKSTKDFDRLFKANKILYRSRVLFITTFVAEAINFILLYFSGCFDSII